MEGVIFDIKRFAVHDGPGIRTTVFLKGCPLNCAWCHNPESRGDGVETLAGRDGPVSVGRLVSEDEVMKAVERDTLFYDESGGGVTFSGGEPLAQPEFLESLLERCGEREIHRTVDTCGYAPRDVLLSVAKRMDLCLYDLKLADAEGHRHYTGVETDPIRDNLKALCDTGVPVEVRIPVVPGITETAANMESLGAFLQSLPRSLPVRLLPYHRAAMDKYTRFGFTPPLPDTPEPADEEMDGLREVMRSLEMEVRE